jgi:hypothetical protein
MLVNLGQDHGETFCLTSNCLIDAAIRPEAGRPCADDQDGISHDIARLANSYLYYSGDVSWNLV